MREFSFVTLPCVVVGIIQEEEAMSDDEVALPRRGVTR